MDKYILCNLCYFPTVGLIKVVLCYIQSIKWTTTGDRLTEIRISVYLTTTPNNKVKNYWMSSETFKLRTIKSSYNDQ